MRGDRPCPSSRSISVLRIENTTLIAGIHPSKKMVTVNDRITSGRIRSGVAVAALHGVSGTPRP